MIYECPIKEGLVRIATDYAMGYKAKPDQVKRVLLNCDSELNLVEDFYRLMVREKEIPPIEEIPEPEKRVIWDEVRQMDCEHERRVRIARSLYSIKVVFE